MGGTVHTYISNHHFNLHHTSFLFLHHFAHQTLYNVYYRDTKFFKHFVLQFSRGICSINTRGLNKNPNVLEVACSLPVFEVLYINFNEQKKNSKFILSKKMSVCIFPNDTKITTMTPLKSEKNWFHRNIKSIKTPDNLFL